MGILSGYRVLDCSIAMAGPFAAQRLGDLVRHLLDVHAQPAAAHPAAIAEKVMMINAFFMLLQILG